jgi:hypothetical protein
MTDPSGTGGPVEDVSGAIAGFRGVVETGFDKRLCAYLGQTQDGPPPCARVATKEVKQRHVGDAFPICDEHFAEFADDYQLVVVRELGS